MAATRSARPLAVATLELDEPPSQSEPIYVRIKRMIARKVATGEWARESRIPSEHELVRSLKVSRMTVHRALRELTDEGMLVRTRGVGTFIAPTKPEASVLEIRDIAEDIRSRGNRHECAVLLSASEPAGPLGSDLFGVPAGARLFHTICLHREDGVPVQYEDRLVNPSAVPGYLDHDFTRVTPTQVLNQAIPSPEIRHVIEAVAVEGRIADLLAMPEGSAGLQMMRTTWSGGCTVTHVRLLHPGNRYRLGGHIKPNGQSAGL